MGTFAGGLATIAFALPGLADGAAPQRLAELRRLRVLNDSVVSPALLLVWALGLTLATKGGWFVASWLQAKIGLVVLLSAFHGYQSRRLHRLTAGKRVSHAYDRWLPLAALATAAVIVVLATAKPG